MGTLKIESFCLGDLFTNAYLLINTTTNNCVLIDAPGTGEIARYIKEHHYSLQYILLTHGHFDHIEALRQIHAPIYIHPADREFLKNPSLNFSSLFTPFTIDKEPLLIEDSQTLLFDGYPLEVLHTPGHTPGSVCMVCQDMLFSGDTLFFDSVGRTDLPYSSGSKLIDSIRTKLFSLPHDIKVFPGHGQDTNLRREIAHNPYLQATTL